MSIEFNEISQDKEERIVTTTLVREDEGEGSLRPKKLCDYYGQEKATGSIEDYLEQNFQLTDHRQDPEYEEWNEQYRTYLEKVKRGVGKRDTEEVEGADE